MWIKKIIIFVSIIFLSLVQASLVSGLPVPFDKLNLMIVVLVFFLAISDNVMNLWVFALAGFVFDMIYIPEVMFLALAWPLTFIFTRFLFVNFFINRSLFSFLATGFFATAFLSILTSAVFYVERLFNSSVILFLLVKDFWWSLLYESVLNLLVIFILFYFFNFLNNRLRPVFMVKF